MQLFVQTRYNGAKGLQGHMPVGAGYGLNNHRLFCILLNPFFVSEVTVHFLSKKKPTFARYAVC